MVIELVCKTWKISSMKRKGNIEVKPKEIEKAEANGDEMSGSGWGK